MKMLDYVQLAHVRMGENLERSSELVAQTRCASLLRVRRAMPPIAPAITCKMPCKCRCPL